MTTPGSEPTPGPQEIPPAFTPNGHSPSQTALALMQQMPQLLANALASVFQQVPVRTDAQRIGCTRCVMNRLAWFAAHGRELEAADKAYREAAAAQAELAEDDPRRSVPVDPAVFVPDRLKPGGAQGYSPVADGCVMVNGALWCMEHVPGAPGQQQLIVARASMSGLFAA